MFCDMSLPANKSAAVFLRWVQNGFAKHFVWTLKFVGKDQHQRVCVSPFSLSANNLSLYRSLHHCVKNYATAAANSQCVISPRTETKWLSSALCLLLHQSSSKPLCVLPPPQPQHYYPQHAQHRDFIRRHRQRPRRRKNAERSRYTPRKRVLTAYARKNY